MFSPFQRLFKIITQLGFTQVALFAFYKLALKTGYFKGVPKPQTTTSSLHFLFDFPTQEALLSILKKDGLTHLLSQADQIVNGQFRIFGGNLTEIKLDLGLPPHHWTAYETHKASLPYDQFLHSDIKYIWEPARFGWAFTLGRAYLATGNEKYAKSFWQYFEIFDKANPANIGPHWMNGQEVAIRLMAFVWAAQIFNESSESTNQRKERIAQSVAEHATRIPPTLLYARSQNNNHLTSEAAGLYTAGLALPDHPDAKKWKKLGIKWLNWSFENQINEKGEYIQHSVNYHRLVLQLALWVIKVTRGAKVEKDNLRHFRVLPWITNKAYQNLSNATRWLAELTDSTSGNAVNLGANDGAYLFPLANGVFRDFRPVVAAASHAFLGEELFPGNEMSLWIAPRKLANLQLATCNLPTLKPLSETWTHLRTTDGNQRLAHADQLHLDLWWRGENIALDSGTYLYNAESPWDNPFPATKVHNTVTVNAQDQMTRASRFMYLDWARGQVIEKSDNQIVAEHDGYRKMGVTHRRSVSFAENTWRVEDNLISKRQSPNIYRLHWLLVDGKWKVENREESVEISLQIQSNLTLQISLITHYASRFSLARAGECLLGDADIPPSRGWYSPTYGVKIPALSLALEVTASDAVQFTSEFKLIPNP
ncbi:MAG: hypothetical protein GY755_03355 [Chloroflexi bacterium]|nr:hypothetical protein [Chloroflexota bacterium]